MNPSIALQKLAGIVKELRSGDAPLARLRLLECAFELAEEAVRKCPEDLIIDAAAILDKALAESTAFKKSALAMLDRGEVGATKRGQIETNLDSLDGLGQDVALRRNTDYLMKEGDS
ncbi:hypothetical protein ACIBI9_46745 [Nonomuraea sp. NPDC050451]|uniref:hypothetical protein n=1 Tax=Nonomuraea sp. NPDC050451 TaxID=3364364 RepID=UPI0037A8051F